MKRTTPVWLVSAIAVVLAVTSARADPVTIFSNFNPDSLNRYDANNGFQILGSDFPVGPISPAMGFTPSGTYVLSQIDVAIAPVYPAPSIVGLALYSDDSGAPGSPLMTWTISPLASSMGFCCSVSTVTPSTSLTPDASITLNASTQYWLMAQSEICCFDLLQLWNLNAINQLGPVWIGQSEWPEGWTTSTSTGLQGAFDVLGENPIPEPASALLVASVIALLGVSLRRRPRP